MTDPDPGGLKTYGPSGSGSTTLPATNALRKKANNGALSLQSLFLSIQAKDVYDSKFSLASRIVNMERQVDSIEEKLQAFLELYQVLTVTTPTIQFFQTL
jgi:hypothetical protein